MTAEFVLDGSLTMAWCFEDEASPETDEIQDWLAADARAYVPTLWHREVANVLWACEKRKRITETDSIQFLKVLAGLNITTRQGSLLGYQRMECARNYASCYGRPAV